MTTYVVLDTSFLVSVIDNTDVHHDDAVFLFNELKERKNVKILVPPLVIYEVIVILRRKGVRAKTIENIIMRLVNLSYVSVLSISELTAFKHASHALNEQDKNKALRTHDFMIFCLGAEFDALIITFDVAMHKKCKQVYEHIFFPAERSEEGYDDETALVLLHADANAGENIEDKDYTAFKAHL